MAKIIRATALTEVGRGGKVVADVREAIVETDADGKLIGQAADVLQMVGELALLGFTVEVESWEIA